MTTVKTPAQAKGFIINVTRLKVSNEDNESYNDGKVWILREDDSTQLPFFRSECGLVANICFYVNDLSIIQEVPQAPRVAFAVDFPSLPDYRKPLPVELEAPAYGAIQKNAVDTFSAMLEAVKLYREDPEANPRPNGLVYNYGICDNIESFAEKAGARYGQMSHVKENLIRTLPSYSGEFHYPVKGSEGKSASDSFSNISDKWGGDYGANRMQQLSELVEAIKDRWSDDLAGRLTPVQRMGYKVGDIFQRLQDGLFYVLHRDDDSSDPGFGPLGSSPDTYSWIPLDSMVKVDNTILPQLAVHEFLEKIAALELQKVEIKRIIAEQEEILKKAVADIGLYDFGLRQQHKVKRI